MFIISIFISFVAFAAFPESNDAILGNEKKELINIESSGSLGVYRSGKCQKTYGNETIVSDEFSDWCSNIPSNKNDKNQNPWIQYSIKGKQMKVKRISVRNGCCRYYSFCCTNDNGKITDYGCCCTLYSYSFHASNDNVTWTLLYKVENDTTFDYCSIKTFEIKTPAPYVYYRLMFDEEWPGCPKCMQVNQVELYGESISSGYLPIGDAGDDDESISIIGRIKKDDQ